MPFFNNTADDWQRLDWQILRDGGIQLYWRREYLVEDTQWFAKHDYDVFELACETWLSQDGMFSDFARVLRLPEWFGRNFDALDECIADLPLTESRGAVIVLSRFDAYAAGAGSAPTRRVFQCLPLLVAAERWTRAQVSSFQIGHSIQWGHEVHQSK